MGRKKISRQETKFDKTAQAYLEIISNTLRPGTVGNYSHSIYSFLKFLSLNYPEITCLKDIKRSPHIENWLTHIAKIGNSKGTRHIRTGCIRRFFTDINEWGWKDTPPLGLITSRDIPVPDKCLPKPLTPEDDKKLQETLRQDHGLIPQALLLLRKTGRRVGELRNLKVNSLEKLPSGDYVLHVPIGKMHKEHIIPVDLETAEIFNHILELRGRFLPVPDEITGEPVQFLIVHKSHRRRPSYCGLLWSIRYYARKAGINKRVSLHTLRHTYATGLLRAGISLPALKELLGHKDISMTLVYTEVTQVDLIQAYHQAIQKSKCIDLLPKQQHEQKKSDSEFIRDSIDDAITKLNSVRKNLPKDKNRKKLQRIAERLRRAYQNIEDTLKTE